MHKLDFRVSFNVTLFNFVDSLSLWDYFVSRHIYKYFDKHYGITSLDRHHLENYAKFRRDFGWEREKQDTLFSG